MKTIIVAIMLMLSSFAGVGASLVPCHNYCEFSATQYVIDESCLTDYSGNTYKLYELNDGYAIYKIINENEIFLEGSYKTNSPYKKYLDKQELIYLGPGSYYYFDNDKYFDILTGETLDTTIIRNAKYELSEQVQTRSSGSSSPNPNKTVVSNNTTFIKDHNYFSKCSLFPYNKLGTCGVTALAILLGYYDTFINDNFIASDTLYNDKKIFETVSNMTLSYENLTFENWTTMPGTTDAMGDYIINNYMHTYAGISGSSGYPMMDAELKQTMIDYVNANCPSLSNSINYISGSVFYTHAKPKECINNGLPVCLVLTKYTYNGTSYNKGKDNHIVVSYGYDGDNFVSHMGWGDAASGDTEVVLSNLTIYGYFAMNYTGNHVCSKNVTVIKPFTASKKMCGCGHLF